MIVTDTDVVRKPIWRYQSSLHRAYT